MGAFFAHATGAAIELFVEEDFYAGVLDHPIHRGLGHMGLEIIHILLAVIFTDSAVEFAGYAAHCVAVEDVARRQSTASHAAEEFGGVD